MVVLAAITRVLVGLAVAIGQLVLVEQLVDVGQCFVAAARPLSLEFFETAIDQWLVQPGFIAVDRILDHLQNFGHILLVSFVEAMPIHGVLGIKVVLIQDELLPAPPLLYPVHDRGIMLFDAAYHLIKIFFMLGGNDRSWAYVVHSLVEQRVLEEQGDGYLLGLLELALAEDGVEPGALAKDVVGTKRVLDLGHKTKVEADFGLFSGSCAFVIIVWELVACVEGHLVLGGVFEVLASKHVSVVRELLVQVLVLTKGQLELFVEILKNNLVKN